MPTWFSRGACRYVLTPSYASAENRMECTAISEGSQNDMKYITHTGLEIGVELATTTDDARSIASIISEKSGERFDDVFARIDNEMRRRRCRFLTASIDGKVVGGVQMSFRREYVEGTTTSPVAYIESISIDDDYRDMGCTKALVRACEAYASMCGCHEIATDCSVSDESAREFLSSIGFDEVRQVSCFVRNIDRKCLHKDERNKAVGDVNKLTKGNVACDRRKMATDGADGDAVAKMNGASGEQKANDGMTVQSCECGTVISEGGGEKLAVPKSDRAVLSAETTGMMPALDVDEMRKLMR